MRIKLKWQELDREMFKVYNKRIELNVDEYNYMVRIFDDNDRTPRNNMTYTFNINDWVRLT